MPRLTVILGESEQTTNVPAGTVVGQAIAEMELSIEQPCAGRGTCGRCKVLVEQGVAGPDEIEARHLTSGEIVLNNRLACRARIAADARVILSPVVVYSNKIFHASNRYKQSAAPLGLAIDLGTTTVAALLVTLDDGAVQSGAAALNQQTVFGADVISRLAAAVQNPINRQRLHRLALASINQAVDALHLSHKIRSRIARVTIVGNVAMHHLLANLPPDTLAVLPFQPYRKAAIRDAHELMDGIFPPETQVTMPPLIGGFVGSDALACLAYFGFERTDRPMAAVDLGTNGEVMVTDGKRILTASTAAGPAFEGVNISCGSRAVDGAVTDLRLEGERLVMKTIADAPPIGLTGSGLIRAIYSLYLGGVIEANGRIAENPPLFAGKLTTDTHGARRIPLTPDGSLGLTQWDVRELQKAKGAIRAAIEILMGRLGLKPADLSRFILTGSFGGQIDIPAVVGLGMIPPVPLERIESIPNGAGYGAAMFLSATGMEAAIRLADLAEQVDLDQDPAFISQYIAALNLTPDLRLPGSD